MSVQISEPYSIGAEEYVVDVTVFGASEIPWQATVFQSRVNDAKRDAERINALLRKGNHAD